MKEWLVDTNVLLDVLGADDRFGVPSKNVLSECAEAGVLVINQVIFAEVGAWMDSLEELESLLPDELFRGDALPWEAAYLAGQAFARYKRAGGRKMRILADFLIGAHAAVAGLELITRDGGMGRHFNIQILNPTEWSDK